MRLVFFALLTLAAAGFSEPMQKGIDPNEDIYNVTASWEGALENTAHTLQLSFHATSSWEIAVQKEALEWLSVKPTSGGSGLNKVRVEVDSNPTPEERSGSFSIIPLIGEPYVVTISQNKTVVNPNAPTSFVFIHNIENHTLPNCVAGYFDEDGYCWKIADLGDMTTGKYTPEITLTNETITEIYLFTDYFSGVVLRRSFPVRKNMRNVFKLREDDYSNEVDKNDPKQYPQEKSPK